MNQHPTQGELRLDLTVEADLIPSPAPTPRVPDPPPLPESVPVPLLRLRGRDREPIRPEDCRVPDCPVCAWRRAGLIPPVVEDDDRFAARTASPQGTGATPTQQA